MEEVHSLCYHGNGGFTHDEIYDMPIRYRHYHLRKITDFLEKQQEAINKDLNPSSTPVSPDKIQIPDFVTKVKAPKN